MYSLQHTIMSYVTMKKRHIMSHVLHGEDSVPFMNDPRISFTRTWNNFISGNYFSNMWSSNNPLSVTVVNDEILNSDGILSNNSPSLKKSKDMSYILQEKTLLIDDLTQRYPKDYIESMIPVSMSGHAPMNHLQDWDIVDDPNLINIRNDVNLIKNSADTYEDNSIMEALSMLRFNETEKTTEDKTIDTSDPSDVGPQIREDGIHEDTDIESFLMVSHSDVPIIPVENPISRFSTICLNAWNSLFSGLLHCKTRSARMSVKRPLYSKKQHRRKANIIAMGRGRGRGKCQLRRSGVSQTIRRKKCIKYESWQNDLVASNDYPIDNKLGNLDNVNILDSTQVTKQIDSPAMSSSPKGTFIKGKSKTRKKKKTKAKCTKIRYRTNSSRMNDYNHCEDSNNEMPNAQENSIRLRTLSESTIDLEDGWIVFEEDELHETCEQGTTVYSDISYISNFSMKKNILAKDIPCKNSNSKTYADAASFRLRSSSESSTNSEDSNCSSIASDEQEATECPRMCYNCLTKIDDEYRKDYNRQMQKNLFRHRRLPSDSSENSDDSNSSENSKSSFAIEESDNVDGCDEMSFHDGDSQLEDDSIIFADEHNEELIAQTKKVSFDLTPIVHVMVTWNYAYRAARRGPWEEIARDNERFRGRINSIAIVLDPILKNKHRSQVWQERFAFPE